MDKDQLEFIKEMDEICSHGFLYKYLDFDGGVKMLENYNIQFTRADKLNDEYDCNWDLLNVKNKDIQYYRFGVCSLGKSFDNYALWAEGYAGSNGLCLALDTKLLFQYLIENEIAQPPSIVKYIKDLKEKDKIEILNNPDPTTAIIDFFRIKDYDKWHEEEEIRFVSFGIFDINDEYKRYELPIGCIKSIYVGSQANNDQLQILENIVLSNDLKVDIIKM